MVIEKTIVDGSKYNVELDNFVAEGELTVTITLNEYRKLIEKSCENERRKEHEDWFKEYQRANEAEKKVEELENELNSLYKQLAPEPCGEEMNNNG